MIIVSLLALVGSEWPLAALPAFLFLPIQLEQEKGLEEILDHAPVPLLAGPAKITEVCAEHLYLVF